MPDADRDYFRHHVFADCEVWGAFAPAVLTGFIAFREGWIDHLYVLPAFQRQGVGGALLDIAKRRGGQIHLWTFKKNAGARAFYAAHGFVAVEETDGDRNEEKEPDVLYLWPGGRVGWLRPRPTRRV